MSSGPSQARMISSWDNVLFAKTVTRPCHRLGFIVNDTAAFTSTLAQGSLYSRVILNYSHQLNLLWHQWESNHFHFIDEGNKDIGGTVVSPSNLTQNLTALTRGTCLRNTHQYLCVLLSRWDHFYRVALSTSGFQTNRLRQNTTYMRLQLLFRHIKYH